MNTMYEQFRDQVLAKLNGVDADTARSMLCAMDSVANNYTFQKQSTQLTVFNNEIPDVCKAYLVSRAIEGLSKKTLEMYRTILTKFFRTMPRALSNITANDMRMWLYNYENENNISKRTMQLYRLIVCGFFTWAVNEGWLNSNPCQQIKPIRYVKKPRKAMSQIELEYIRTACKTPQELAIVEMLYSTACRVTELSTLKLKDINWEHKEITILGKGNKYRTAYLNAKAVVALKQYIATRKDDSEYVIVSQRSPHCRLGKSGIERLIKIIAKRVEGKLSVPVTPHVFRHTTATQALQSGMPVQDVQMMLGHSSINTTMVYAQVDKNDVKTMHTKCVV